MRILLIRVLNHFLINSAHQNYCLQCTLTRCFFKLLFLRSTSFQIRKKLQKLFSDKLTSCNLKIAFTSPVTVKSFYTFKGKLVNMLLSRLVCKCKCVGCNATYYGKTKRYFKNRISEHLGILHLTGNKVKIDNSTLTVIQDSNLLCWN